MDELDRLFELLVEVLAGDARLAVPFPAADVHERLVPYRSNRSRLKVATHQDYEMAVLRLLAGERGYARLEPDDVQQAMQREVTAANPDTGMFRNFPDARVMINRRAAERFLRGEEAYAPPPESPGSEFEIEDTLPQGTDSPGEEQCPYCGGSLPANRKVNFCPHCGQPPSGELKCPACGNEVDVGWAYCMSCGRATGFE